MSVILSRDRSAIDQKAILFLERTNLFRPAPAGAGRSGSGAEDWAVDSVAVRQSLPGPAGERRIRMVCCKHRARREVPQGRKRKAAPLLNRFVVSGIFRKLCKIMPLDSRTKLDGRPADRRFAGRSPAASNIATGAESSRPKQCPPLRIARHSNCRADRRLPS